MGLTPDIAVEPGLALDVAILLLAQRPDTIHRAPRLGDDKQAPKHYLRRMSIMRVGSGLAEKLQGNPPLEIRIY